MTSIPNIELVVLDMAGTTVQDDGLVEQAFLAANAAAHLAQDPESIERMLDYVRATMGFSKIDWRVAVDGM